MKIEAAEAQVNFGNNLRRNRLAAGLTQGELGDIIGENRSVISRYERGIGYPNSIILIKIVNALGQSLDSYFVKPIPGLSKIVFK